MHSPAYPSPLYNLQYVLFSIHSPIYILHYTFSRKHSLLYIFQCTLSISPFFNIHTLSLKHSPVYTLHYTLSSVHSPFPILRYTLSLTHSPVHTLHYTVCSPVYASPVYTSPVYTFQNTLSSIPSLLYNRHPSLYTLSTFYVIHYQFFFFFRFPAHRGLSL